MQRQDNKETSKGGKYWKIRRTAGNSYRNYIKKRNVKTKAGKKRVMVEERK